MLGNNLFLRMGTDSKDNAKQVVDFIVLQLKEASANLECNDQAASTLGDGFEKATRPWAFLFCKDDQHIRHVLKEKAIALFQGQLDAQDRKWLDSIQICRVETVHHLKAIMCSLHLKPTAVRPNHILSWLEEEKYGQPPSLMVVVDLMDLMLETKTVTDSLRYTRLDCTEVAQVLSTLVESSIYEGTHQKEVWEKRIGVETNISTDLLITDNSCLPSNTDDLESVYSVIQYYIERMI